MDRLTDKAFLQEELEKVNALKESIFFDDEVKSNAFIASFIKYVFSQQGKSIRPLVALLSGNVFGTANRLTYLSAIVVDVLHESTLLHDDVVDNATLRRGQISSNSKFGNKAAVLMGDYLLSKMMEICMKEQAFKLVEIIATTLVALSKGELVQLKAKNDSKSSVDQLIKIAELKTGSLIKASCVAGAHSCGASTEDLDIIGEYANCFGVAYQIKDDILDYTIKEKEAFKDVKEGKVNIPLALALKAADADKRDDILKLVTTSEKSAADLEYIENFIKNHKGIELAENLQQEYIDKAIKQLEMIPNTADLIAFTNKVASRKK